jgi:hypothetical protein
VKVSKLLPLNQFVPTPASTERYPLRSLCPVGLRTAFPPRQHMDIATTNRYTFNDACIPASIFSCHRSHSLRFSVNTPPPISTIPFISGKELAFGIPARHPRDPIVHPKESSHFQLSVLITGMLDYLVSSSRFKFGDEHPAVDYFDVCHSSWQLEREVLVRVDDDKRPSTSWYISIGSRNRLIPVLRSFSFQGIFWARCEPFVRTKEQLANGDRIRRHFGREATI